MLGAMRNLWFVLACVLAGCAGQPQHSPLATAASSGDAGFHQLAEEYLTGYLAWRPQEATALGFHQYDGKLTDFSRASLDAELARLQRFEQRLAAFDTNKLSAVARYDYRLLHSAI